MFGKLKNLPFDISTANLEAQELLKTLRDMRKELDFMQNSLDRMLITATELSAKVAISYCMAEDKAGRPDGLLD